MADAEQDAQGIRLEVLKSALKAFKKRLKLTALDDDSRLGKGPFSSGAQGLCAIAPPNQFPKTVWEELVKQGKLRNAGQGLYQLEENKAEGSKKSEGKH